METVVGSQSSQEMRHMGYTCDEESESQSRTEGGGWSRGELPTSNSKTLLPPSVLESQEEEVVYNFLLLS